ncbi:MAG TPA: glutamate-1-semialdehyde 2,1-aminomutase [Gammaproteobacteria bacterium]|nr:glutamate-1-semialdehyde 2,1-aminomutase [Gammaproteobacteria bacterium]
MNKLSPSFTYRRSEALFKRAKNVIPNGIPGHFNPASQLPMGTYPFYVDRAKGSRFWDVDGNEYIDYMCAYGPMILGYNNEVVEQAVREQLTKADTCTLASPVMVDLAELLVDFVPWADWATFAKNGADATNMAVLIARTHTGRRKLIAIEGGYHGTSPWMQAKTRAGIDKGDHHDVIRIPWNNLPALQATLLAHEGEIAAFISSPYHHPVYEDNVLPDPSYWEGVHRLLREHNVLSICDDVRAGFRLSMEGSPAYFGYTPDLSCYCKAIANGYPIAAVVGHSELNDAATSVFQTGSFWFSAGPMAAALACLKELRRLEAPTRILETGAALWSGLQSISADAGFELVVSGIPSMAYLRTEHDAGPRFHQSLCGECARRGLFLTSHHNLFVSAAHTEGDLAQSFEIFEDALKATKAQFKVE